MSEMQIPPASLERLKVAYTQFEQLAAVVAEAMGIPPGTPMQINVQRGVFVLEESAPVEEPAKNGVAA